MDPLLEHPEVFPNLHNSMIIYLMEALQPRLPGPYFAKAGQRVWIEVTERYVEPDVYVLRGRQQPQQEQDGEGGAVAVAAMPRTRPVVITVPHDERREPFAQIFVREDDRLRLVVSIEILSLTNKTPGEHGRDLYLQKQRELLYSKVHLVEIDLLRGGEHSTACPRKRILREVGPFDYHVCVHRFDNLEDFLIYPVRMEERLPEIEIPLLPQDGAVAVDLQAVFDRCYDAGPYRREIRYDKDQPVPPLTPEQAQWAGGFLPKKG
jgi:hypothetical protein